MAEGFFITFEGGEGAGKSTQVRLLKEACERLGVPVVVTREPGGTPGGEAIRKLLVEGKTDAWAPMTELLLHMAARAEHIERLIRPALDEGKIVICDRFMDSTMVYQGMAQGLSPSLVAELHEASFGAFYPHITFVLDVPPKAGLKRTEGRKEGVSRYEAMDHTFHEALREGYASLKGERFVHINATEPVSAVQQAVLSALKNYPLFEIISA